MDNMQLWLSSSTDSINLNDSAEGFYLNPDLEGLTGTPEIRSVNGLNAGYDGGWTATQLWAARLITIRGVIALNDKAAVETKRKALAKLMAQGKNESLQLKFVSESGNVYTTSVRTTYCTMALKRVFWRQEYQIQLRADDPLIYDDGGAELVAILRVMAGVNGFEIPFEIPFAIGDSADPTDVNVGDEATYPLITLKGDLHSPTIVNLTTNQQMQVLADIITHVEWKAYTTAQTIDGYLQIQDGLQDAPLTLTKLTGNATQKTLSGKNLINFKTATYYTAWKASYTKNDDSLTVQATEGNNYASVSYKTCDCVQGTTYTFSMKATKPTTAGAIPNARLGKNTNASADIISLCTSTLQPDGYYLIKHTFTANSNFTLNISFYPNYGSTDIASSTFYDVQLELGAQASDYEEFCGGTPSPSPDYPQDIQVVTGDSTVKITGKNLLQIASPTRTHVSAGGVTVTLGDDGLITLNGTATSNAWPDLIYGINTNTVFHPTTFNTYSESTVTMSAKVVSGTATGTGTAGISVYYNNAGDKSTVIRYTDMSATSAATPTRGINRAFIFIPNGATFDNYSFYIQVEAGSSASEFEPYISQNYVIPFGDTYLAKIGDYADEPVKVDGAWYIRRAIGKVVLDGTESTWAYTSGQHARFQYSNSTIALEPSPSAVGAVMSDHFTASSTNDIYNGIDGKIGVHATIHQFWFSHLAITDLNGFKTWLSTHPTTVYYALATPTDTEITDSELIEQLNHIYSLYGGVNNLWLIPSAGAQGEMEVSYATDKDVDYHEVVIDCQARTVTQDGQNLYPALAPGSEFIRLLPGENRLYLTSEVESDNGTAEVKFKKGNISI